MRRHWWTDRQSVVKENDCSSPQAAGLATLQMTLWSGVLRCTCRIIMWCTCVVGSKVGMPGCTWVAVHAVVRPPVQSTLDVFLVFCVLVGCARFGRQEGHVMTEGVQRSAVTRGGRLAELLCHLCNVQRKKHSGQRQPVVYMCWTNKQNYTVSPKSLWTFECVFWLNSHPTSFTFLLSCLFWILCHKLHRQLTYFKNCKAQ